MPPLRIRKTAMTITLSHLHNYGLLFNSHGHLPPLLCLLTPTEPLNSPVTINQFYSQISQPQNLLRSEPNLFHIPAQASAQRPLSSRHQQPRSICLNAWDSHDQNDEWVGIASAQCARVSSSFLLVGTSK